MRKQVFRVPCEDTNTGHNLIKAVSHPVTTRCSRPLIACTTSLSDESIHFPFMNNFKLMLCNHFNVGIMLKVRALAAGMQLPVKI